MSRLLHTQERFFLRRTGSFFLIMLIPTLLLLGFNSYFSITRTQNEIDMKGRQTIAAVEGNCELIISNVFTQNDLFTGTTRMSMALDHSLNGTSTSYTDAIFLSSLRSVLKSVVNTHYYIDSIYIYLEDAPRYFDSYKGIVDLSTSPDLSWLPVYEGMEPTMKEMIRLRYGEYNKTQISFFKRLLMQKGCAVVNILPEKWGKSLETLLTRAHESIVLLDADGYILATASNAQDGAPTQSDMDILLGQMAEADFQGWLSANGKHYYINTGKYDDMRIVTTVSTKLMRESLLKNTQVFLWVVLLNVLIILLLSYMTTRRSFCQIKLMLQMFEAAEQGKMVEKPDNRVQDEYDAVMSNIVYMFLKENALRSQLKENQLEKEHSELMALQLQINPHFLYNTLQTLQMEIRSGKCSPIDMGELVQRISDILRYALSSPQETVTLQEELQYLRKYATVQQYRFGERFILYYEADDDLLETPVFRLMLQPMVENSLLHGMKDNGERLYIWVHVERKEDRIRFTVSDTGKGMTEDEVHLLMEKIHNAQSRSIGLTNLNRRLLLYYGADSQLHIHSAPGKGTEISFSIPPC